MNNIDYYNSLIINEKTILNRPKVNYRFKIVYAIAMLSVIASHCRGKGSIEFNIQGWFNYGSFHMPLFMFSAGYFFKNKNVNHTCLYIYGKFKRLIIPIYLYNIFYGFYNHLLKNIGFENIRPFSFRIIFIEPSIGKGYRNVLPSWFCSALFCVQVYNILKRKLTTTIFKKKTHELFYLIIDFFISSYSVILSNKGYNNITAYRIILRFTHLNIYYELGIFYKNDIEAFVENIKSDIYFIIIFTLKLLFHLYYSKEINFYYGASQYYNYSPLTVIIISILGISFWIRICRILEPILGTIFYINIIADNTYSIMINHLAAIDIIKMFFAFISKKTHYCKNFDFKRFYLFDSSYIYIPNNVRQSGILYFISSLYIPIIIQKAIDNIKKIINFSGL